MTIETPSRSAATENRRAARQWIDAFNARDNEGEANEVQDTVARATWQRPRLRGR